MRQTGYARGRFTRRTVCATGRARRRGSRGARKCVSNSPAPAPPFSTPAPLCKPASRLQSRPSTTRQTQWASLDPDPDQGLLEDSENGLALILTLAFILTPGTRRPRGRPGQGIPEGAHGGAGLYKRQRCGHPRGCLLSNKLRRGRRVGRGHPQRHSKPNPQPQPEPQLGSGDSGGASPRGRGGGPPPSPPPSAFALPSPRSA